MKIIETEKGLVITNNYGYTVEIENLHAKGLKVTQHNLEPTVDDQVLRILADTDVSLTSARIRAIKLLTVVCSMNLRQAVDAIKEKKC